MKGWVCGFQMKISTNQDAMRQMIDQDVEGCIQWQSKNRYSAFCIGNMVERNHLMDKIQGEIIGCPKPGDIHMSALKGITLFIR